jgi:transposase
LCRDEGTLSEQRTAFITQLRPALAEYYPIALEAFDNWGAPGAGRFVQRFPTPQALQAAGKRQWEKLLHSHQLWRTESGPRRLDPFARATDFGGSAPTAKAKSQLALALVSLRLTVEPQLGLYRQRIEELFGRHPDHDRFGSLPGAGPKLAPRLLAEIGDDRARFGDDPQALRCLA